MIFLQTLIMWISMIPGAILMKMAVNRFLPEKRGLLYKLIIVLLFSIVIALPSWIGDENPLIIFPFFMTAFLFCYSGRWYARLVVGIAFYALLLPLNMMMDTALRYPITHLIWIKTLLWGLIWLLVWRFVPKTMQLIRSVKLWMLIGGLSLAPLFATLSFTFWNVRWFEEGVYRTVALRLGYTILPFTMLSSMALLAALVVLSRHEELEQRQKLAEIQAVYYQGLQREQAEVRTLRHDLHNHIIVAKSLLEQKDTTGAARYLEKLSASGALTGTRMICENEIANAILSSKAAIMEREGMEADWAVNLPQTLAVTDVDLCVLLGNALDNAVEAARTAEDKRIIVRARTDKGVLMLRVENAIGTHPRMEKGVFLTTKDNPDAHGLGLGSMGDIARRYSGSLEVKAENGRFELVAYLPL